MSEIPAGGAGDLHQVGVASGSAMIVQAGRDATVLVESARRVVWPVRVGVPPKVVDHFQDRSATSGLAEALAVGTTAVLTGTRADAVVSGLGGVGKSQLAARHAWSTWRDPSVDVALWLSARSRDSVVAEYAEAGRRVLCEQDPGIVDRSPADVALLFRDWLAVTPRRWLVVLDDVQDPHDIRELWPPDSPTGQVVVTTRRRDGVLAQGNRRIVELGVFTELEAQEYFFGALPGLPDPGDVHGLAADLGYLPLALAQAAAFIVNRPLLSVAGYRERFADRRHKLADVMPSEPELPDEHRTTVAATWSLSIDLADRSRPEGLARPLLELASLLDPAGIPVAVFTTDVVLAHLAGVVGRPVDTDDVADALGCLHRLSLIALDATTSARTVAVHALVQRAVRDTIDLARTHELANLTANALFTAWPEVDSRHIELTQALRSAAAVLHANTTPALWIPDGHVVLFHSGWSLGETGQASEAVGYFEDMLQQAVHHLGTDHTDTLSVRNNLIYWLGVTGATASVVTMYEELLVDRVRVSGTDHRDTLSTRHNLAQWRGHSGDITGAMADFEALLADCGRLMGESADITLSTREHLASWRDQSGTARTAMAEYQALLADSVRTHGSEHATVLGIRRNMALATAQSGDLRGAVADLEPLLADHRRLLGHDHPNTLNVTNSLADLRGEAGDPARAAVELEQVVADYRRVLGAENPDTLQVRGRLAHWRARSGDLPQAMTDYLDVLSDHWRLLGDDHPRTLTVREDLCDLFSAAGETAHAIAQLETLLSARRRVLGHDHVETLETHGLLARCRGDANDGSGAHAEWSALLEDSERALGPDHRLTLAARGNLTNIRFVSGDLLGALAEYEVLLADNRRTLGIGHPQTVLVQESYDNCLAVVSVFDVLRGSSGH